MLSQPYQYILWDRKLHGFCVNDMNWFNINDVIWDIILNYSNEPVLSS